MDDPDVITLGHVDDPPPVHRWTVRRRQLPGGETMFYLDFPDGATRALPWNVAVGLAKLILRAEGARI